MSEHTEQLAGVRAVSADDFPKCIVVAAGPSECGKTRALEELFLCHAPRRLSIDFNGEMRRKHGDVVIEVFSIASLRDALGAAAQYDRWHIALCVAPDAMPEIAPELSRILNPTRTSSTHVAFAIEVGGIAVDCSEARNLMPNVKAKWASDTVAWAERGRHNRLSLFMATQAPQSVERRLTDSASVLLAFRTQEEAVWTYWRSSTSSPIADLIAELPAYHFAWIDKDKQLVYLHDDEREVYRVLDYKGRDVDPDGGESESGGLVVRLDDDPDDGAATPSADGDAAADPPLEA